MDATSLMLSLFFGSIGVGYFIYGRRQGKPVPVLVGMILCICPYFLPTPLIMALVCLPLSAVPFITARLWDL